MKQKRNRNEEQLVRDVWQPNDERGLRSGRNSANEAKQLGSDRTPDKNKNKTKKRQRQRYAVRWRKYLPPKGRNLRHYD